VDLHGHQRRVGYIEWHPTAENIILSAGYDFKVLVINNINNSNAVYISYAINYYFCVPRKWSIN
jgi:hypothetical protein